MTSNISLGQTTNTLLPIDVRKKVGGLDVIDSGSIISYNSDDIDLFINSINIKFQFLTDSNMQKGANMRIEPCPNDSRLTFVKLFNIDQALPEGSTGPLHMVNVGSSRVFISFFVSTVNPNNGTRIFQYTVTAER